MIFNLTTPVINKLPEFTYTGTSSLLDDGSGNWRIKFLSSGKFTPKKNMTVDVFLVGGGGSGNRGILGNAAGGGGSGFTLTKSSVSLTANTEYDIVIGAGGSNANGGNSSAFGSTANGGKISSTRTKGGDGGSGGGDSNGGEGGIDGANGGGTSGGTGQGTTTREFGETSGTLYATGGGGTDSSTEEVDGAENTGNGGGATRYTTAGAGGSGIVIIRKHKG